MTPLTIFAGAAILALACSAAYLWHLLHELPPSRRMLNLLMPLSQTAFVACSFALKPYFAYGDLIVLLAALTGTVCAALNPMLFKSLLDAERADLEAERAALLEDQVTAQRHYALLMQQSEREAKRIRTELDAELAGVEQALALGDAAAVQKHLTGAAHAVRTPENRHCQHPVVDALLATKAAWCAEELIRLDVDAEVPDNLPTPDAELCALFANALDNAIHACAELPAGARWIRVHAHPALGHFLLEVENSCAAPNGTDGPRERRRSAAGHLPEHGLGLSIMRDIVGRHGGDLTCTRGDGTFLLSAIWRL